MVGGTAARAAMAFGSETVHGTAAGAAVAAALVDSATADDLADVDAAEANIVSRLREAERAQEATT